MSEDMERADNLPENEWRDMSDVLQPVYFRVARVSALMEDGVTEMIGIDFAVNAHGEDGEVAEMLLALVLFPEDAQNLADDLIVQIIDLAKS